MAGQTLFDVLGVEPDADEHEVHEAWRHHFLEADADHDQVRQDVKDAYLFLQSDQNRTWYREIVRACRKEYPIKLEPHEERAFRGLCRLSHIQVFADLKMPCTFHVRLPGQFPPKWSTQPAAPVQLTNWQKAVRAVRRILLLQAFRGKSGAQQIGLALLYIGAIYLPYWSAQQISERRTQARGAAIKASHAHVSELLSELKDKEQSMLAKFQELTGAKPDPRTGQFSTASLQMAEARRLQPTVGEAWDAILNARIAPDKWSAVMAAQAAIEDRLKLATFLQEDQSQLDETSKWAQAALDSVKAQEPKLKHIRTMLEASRWQNSQVQPERSSP